MLNLNQAINELIKEDSQSSSFHGLERRLQTQATDEDNIIEVKSDIIQSLPIPMLWNWDRNPTGQITRAQFEFCDTMPSNAIPGEFNPSGNSFSNNYADFLELLNRNTFIPKSILTNNILVNKLPTDPVSVNTEIRGWTRVPNASGALNWQRLWGVSSSPEKWLQSVASGEENKPLTLIFDSTSAHVVLSNAQSINVPEDQIEKVTITASAWGRITINPGDWFGNTVIEIAKSDESVFIKPNFIDVAFGPNGIIKSRVSEFIVAYMPSASITINSDFARSNNIQENAIQEISIAGFTYNKSNDTHAINEIKDSTIQLDSSAQGTQLAARTSSSQDNKAYIIAVILQEY